MDGGRVTKEMDGESVAKEIMDSEGCWELPANMTPVELWSPTDGDEGNGRSPGVMGKGKQVLCGLEKPLPCVSERHLKYVGEFF